MKLESNKMLSELWSKLCALSDLFGSLTQECEEDMGHILLRVEEAEPITPATWQEGSSPFRTLSLQLSK